MIRIPVTGVQAAEMISQGRNLVPLAEYKKPLLNLDPASKRVIKQAKSSIRRLQGLLNQIDQELSTPWLSEYDRAVLTRRKDNFMRSISEEQAYIRLRKMEAYTAQLDSASGKNLSINA